MYAIQHGKLSFTCFFFFNDTATTEIYTLSLHDALPISHTSPRACAPGRPPCRTPPPSTRARSEEHTSELQSHSDLVCRLLLEKKKRRDRPPRSDFALEHVDETAAQPRHPPPSRRLPRHV